MATFTKSQIYIAQGAMTMFSKRNNKMQLCLT